MEDNKNCILIKFIIRSGGIPEYFYSAHKEKDLNVRLQQFAEDSLSLIKGSFVEIFGALFGLTHRNTEHNLILAISFSICPLMVKVCFCWPSNCSGVSWWNTHCVLLCCAMSSKKCYVSQISSVVLSARFSSRSTDCLLTDCEYVNWHVSGFNVI